MSTKQDISLQIYHMSKKPFTIRIESETRARFAEVARHAHQDDTTFAQMVIGMLSDLKPDCGLKALAAIPDELFRRGPGRPHGSVSKT